MTKLRVGWLQDGALGTEIGGAELSYEGLLRATPPNVEICYMLPGRVRAGCDVYVVANCTEYGPQDLEPLAGARVVKRVADMWPRGSSVVRAWMLEHADCVFLSRGHVEHFPLATPEPERIWIIPPAVDLRAFIQAGHLQRIKGERREGVLWLGRMVPVKGVMEAATWARENDTRVDFYGWQWNYMADLPPWCYFHGEIGPAQVPALMARYRYFLYLPPAFDPFARTALEARLAGCNAILNQNVGCVEYFDGMRHDNWEADYMRRATTDFWRLVRGQEVAHEWAG